VCALGITLEFSPTCNILNSNVLFLRNSPVDCFGSIVRLLKRASKNRAVPLNVHDVFINQYA
jgi:hypothetical protein